MALRSAWKGFLKLSLVSLPVKAYSASASASGEVRLNQLHAECHSRIKYKKTCPIHGEVSQDQIVSGYEYAKDQYVVVDPDELDKLRTEDSKAINLQEFIEPDALSPVYCTEKTYYLVPDGPVGQRPYSVILQGLTELNRYGIGQMVLHGKEQVVMVRPLDGLIAVTPLNYDHEVTKPVTFQDEAPKVDVVPEELKLIKMLIESATSKDFDYTKYKDVYMEKLTQLIEAKVAGKEIVAPPVQEHAHVINLMDALKQSVEKLQAQEKPPQKVAPSKKAKGTETRKKKTS